MDGSPRLVQQRIKESNKNDEAMMSLTLSGLVLCRSSDILQEMKYKTTHLDSHTPIRKEQTAGIRDLTPD